MKKNFITGGAGFIGSHIVDELIQKGEEVVVYDNLSTGKLFFLEQHIKCPRFKFVKGDLLDYRRLVKEMRDANWVFHFAANADVRGGFLNHEIDHNQNLNGTRNVLEAMYENGIKNIVFPSTSSVYGDAKVHPTPEDYPFEPTSLYGASKAACESYIYTYSNYFNWNAYIFRFVSMIGERYTHGIIYDLMKRLKNNPKTLELFSDGTPQKSSVYVKDAINAIFLVIKKYPKGIHIYNIGHDEIVTVDMMVEWILENLGVSPEKKYLGGKRGWKGDNDFVLLDNSRLKKEGWRPKVTIEEAVCLTIEYLKLHPEVLT